MRKQQRQILLAGFAPTLIVVSLSLVLLGQRPNVTDLLLAIVATAAAFYCSIRLKRCLDTGLFKPLRLLAADITRMEPGLPVGNRPPLLEQLVVALERRMSELDKRQDSQSKDLQIENSRLERLVGELSDTLGSLQQTVSAQQDRKFVDDQYISAIADAISSPVTSLIAGINLLTAEGGLNARSAHRIVANAETLAFLAREAGRFDYSHLPETTFDIRQLTDEVIAAISPAMLPRTAQLLPFYDAYGHKRFIGHAGMIKALLFNYLLATVLTGDAEGIELHVSHLADGQLAFALSPQVRADTDLQHRRLASLISPLAATINDGMLLIPIVSDDDYEQPEVSLHAMIVCHDDQARASLESRLESMRVTVTGQHFDVDVCLANITDEQEILGLREKLSHHARLLLFRNTSALPLYETRQMQWPIAHDALAAELLELADSRARTTPIVLAVDDNPSNLKLLTLQLNELGVAVETADDGATALALASRHEFSMVIMDMQLPDSTGPEIAASMRVGNHREIPIIILTARIDDEERRKLPDAGISDVLLKPATRPMLAQLLATHKLIQKIPGPAHRPALSASHNRLLASFDPALALRLANNRPDVAEEILDELMLSLPNERNDVNADFEAGRITALQARVHRLHGALQYCGLPRLKNAVAKLETLARRGNDQETRLALSVFNSEVDVVSDWYDPEESYFDTSILRGHEDRKAP